MYKNPIIRIMWCTDCHQFCEHTVWYGVMVKKNERSCVRFENSCNDCAKLSKKRGEEAYANIDEIPLPDYTALLNNHYWT